MVRTPQLLLLPSALLSLFCQAQNLVPNPSFDVQSGCPGPGEIELASPWISPTPAAADLFNTTCPTQNGPARTGIGSAGVVVHGEGASLEMREYVQAELSAPLVAGQVYCASVWIERFDCRYATDRLGILITTSPVNNAGTGVLPYSPQVQNPAGNTLVAAEWTEVSGEFFSEGGERYITIGSFSNAASTGAVVIDADNPNAFAAYKLDDVSVLACSVGMNEIPLDDLRLFPMPAHDKLQMTLPEGVRLEETQLFDGTGRLVRSFSEQGANGRVQFDVADLPWGLHHLVLRTNKGFTSRAVLIGQ